MTVIINLLLGIDLLLGKLPFDSPRTDGLTGLVSKEETRVYGSFDCVLACLK